MLSAMRHLRRRQLTYLALAATDTWLATTDRRKLRLLTKPLLMPALASVTSARPAPDPKVCAALAGSWLGDVALIRRGPEAFVVGASAFGLGQLGWLSSLTPRTRPGTWTSGSTKALAGVWAVSALPVSVAAARQHRPLGVVLSAYAGALTAVSAAALGLSHDQPFRASRAAQAGALLFLASDGLIGLSRFVLASDDPRWDGAVMATYTAAQLLLEEGVSGLR